MFSFTHDMFSVSPCPNSYTLFIILWKVSNWIIQISRQMLSFSCLRFRVGVNYILQIPPERVKSWGVMLGEKGGHSASSYKEMKIMSYRKCLRRNVVSLAVCGAAVSCWTLTSHKYLYVLLYGKLVVPTRWSSSSTYSKWNKNMERYRPQNQCLSGAPRLKVSVVRIYLAEWLDEYLRKSKS